MRSLLRLGAVSAVIAALTACVELDTKVTLAADGSGTMSVHTLLLDSFLDLVREREGKAVDEKLQKKMPVALSAEKTAELSAAGITVTHLAAESNDRGFAWDAALSFQSPASLSAIGAEGSLETTPALWIVDLGGGSYEAHLKERSSGSDMAGGESNPGEPAKKKSKKEVQKDMEMLGKMMGTLKDLRMTYSVEVPGTIVSVQPDGGVITGSSVAWTVDGAKIAAAFKETPAQQSSEMIVRFQMPEGQSLPATAISTPAE